MNGPTLERARRLLAGAAHPVSFSGAGLSAESGIATFRDPLDGLWARHDPMRLASRRGFAADPGLVLAWYAERRRAAAAARPNPGHRALAAWEGATHVTQNVDDLLERAGALDVVHLHGLLGFDRCDGAYGYRVGADPADPPVLRPCPRCGSPLRPDVVWFGESLDPGAWDRAAAACKRADLLVVVGTSGVVHPAASLVYAARAGGAVIVVVDPDANELGDLADLVLTEKAGVVLPELLAPAG